MSDAQVLDACGRIDAGAAAVRVFVIACRDGAEETTGDNVAGRQLALRGISEVVAEAHKDLQNTKGGDAFNSIPLCFFVEMVWAAEQALWVALCEMGDVAPCNADLCELLSLALKFHADAQAAWPALLAAGSRGAAKAAKGGAA